MLMRSQGPRAAAARRPACHPPPPATPLWLLRDSGSREGPLHPAGRLPRRFCGRDQEGVPQAGPQAPSGCEQSGERRPGGAPPQRALRSVAALSLTRPARRARSRTRGSGSWRPKRRTSSCLTSGRGAARRPDPGQAGAALPARRPAAGGARAAARAARGRRRSSSGGSGTRRRSRCTASVRRPAATRPALHIQQGPARPPTHPACRAPPQHWFPCFRPALH